MFEPGTSKDTSNCMSLNNSKDDYIKNNKKHKDSSKKSTKRDLIESLVSEAASQLNVQYVTKKKLKNLQNETNKKRKSCGPVQKKPKSSKVQRLSCGGRICSEQGNIANDIASFNFEEHAQKEVEAEEVNDYLLMVNKQLQALQELPIIRNSSTSEIQNFITKLDESQIEKFLRKKMDGIRPSVNSDPNAKSMFSFIQKNVILPVYQKRSSTEVLASSEHDTSSDNCSETFQNSQEVVVNAECLKKKSHKSAAKSKSPIEVNLGNDSTEVTSTSVVEDEDEITSSSEFKVIQSKVLEKINPSDLFKLTRQELYNFGSLLCDGQEEESNFASVLFEKSEMLNPKTSSAENSKTVAKKDIKKFFIWLITFVDMLKMCTDILVNADSELEDVTLKVAKCVSVVQMEGCISESLEKTGNKNSCAHCQCCVLKSNGINSKEVNSTVTNEGGSSNLSNLEDNATTSTSLENMDISSTTTLVAQIASPVSTIQSEIIKGENFIEGDDMSDDTVVRSEDEAPDGGVFKCKKCAYTTKSKLKLKRHVKYAKKNPTMYNHKKKSIKKSEN